MLFRLIGKLYFYFCVVPFLGRVAKTSLEMMLDYQSHKGVDPTWTWEKQHRRNVDRALHPRRPRRIA